MRGLRRRGNGPPSGCDDVPRWQALVAVTALSAVTLVALQSVNRVRLEGQRNRALAQEQTTRQNLYAADVFLAQGALTSGNLGLARRALEAHVPQAGQKDLRGFEWRYLWSQCQGDQVAILNVHIRRRAGSRRAGSPWPADQRAGVRLECGELASDSGARSNGRAADRIPYARRVTHDEPAIPGITVWQAWNGALLSTLRGPTNEVVTVRFAPDGRTLASFTRRAGLKLWSVDDGRELRTLAFTAGHANDLAFSPAGDWLAAADRGNTIQLWNAATGEPVATLTGHAEPVVRLAFAPDGRTLASASEDGTVKLWSLAARRELAALFRGDPKVWLEFSRDGQALFGASTNGHLHVWRAPPRD